MSIWGEAALQAWAAQRGLAFEGEGLFPAATPLLREGLDAGPHRAGVITSETEHSITSTGGFSKKAERHTANICRGRLPGGLDGALGHHFHLEYRSTGGEGGDSWLAVPHTVVLAYVPEGARVCRELRFVDGGWTTDPPEAGADVAELTAGVTVPDGYYESTVEMRDGMLCVAVRGVVEDAAELDALCLAAASVADGARRAAARYPPFDPTVPTARRSCRPTCSGSSTPLSRSTGRRRRRRCRRRWPRTRRCTASGTGARAATSARPPSWCCSSSG
jgi:hypothetical protein